MLHGLRYLHRERHTIHRDIKPSNLLVDASGKIKIADFGVSGELGDTLAKAATWVGTVHYMSPERILGGAYAYDSDVWSFGITILELATLRFPYPPAPPAAPQQRLGFWDLLDCIVESPPPAPPATAAAPLASLVTACLQKQPAARASSSALLQHPFVAAHAARPLDAGAWARGVLAKLPADGPRPPDARRAARRAGARAAAAGAAAAGRRGDGRGLTRTFETYCRLKSASRRWFWRPGINRTLLDFFLARWFPVNPCAQLNPVSSHSIQPFTPARKNVLSAEHLALGLPPPD